MGENQPTDHPDYRYSRVATSPRWWMHLKLKPSFTHNLQELKELLDEIAGKTMTVEELMEATAYYVIPAKTDGGTEIRMLSMAYLAVPITRWSTLAAGLRAIRDYRTSTR